MAISNSSDLDNGLITVLHTDATLHGLLPDGVYMDEAPQGSRRFAIVHVADAFDRGVFEQRAIETVVYLVEARSLSTENVDMKAAAQRIDELLENLIPTIAGYQVLDVVRMNRVRLTEVDQENA